LKRAYLVELRKKNNLTQKYVAMKLSIKQNTFSMIENGQRRTKLTLELINGFSEVFNVPITQIIELESKYQEELKTSRKGINTYNEKVV